MLSSLKLIDLSPQVFKHNIQPVVDHSLLNASLPISVKFFYLWHQHVPRASSLWSPGSPRWTAR